jgi:mannose-6-phosphate isomerase
MSAPVRLKPAHHERVWGIPWPDGPHAGKTIGEAWFMADPPLPILPKFLYTSANLSVQVHPGGECGVGKTEMWHILEAEPGATIALGFKQPVSAAQMREAALNGTIEGLLRYIPVKPGETYFIPAGTVHAIGAGLTICEIQQNSDITYRLYDYGRPRELHLDLGIGAVKLDGWRHPGACVPEDSADGWKRLVACPYFLTDSIELGGPLKYQPLSSRFELLICTAGGGSIDGRRLNDFEVWLLPPGCGTVSIDCHSALSLLRSYPPG